jgi:hypothetical protein
MCIMGLGSHNKYCISALGRMTCLPCGVGQGEPCLAIISLLSWTRKPDKDKGPGWGKACLASVQGAVIIGGVTRW